MYCIDKELIHLLYAQCSQYSVSKLLYTLSHYPPRDLRECIENASVVYHSSENLLKSDNFTMLKGSSVALERIEGVFIHPPPTSPQANDDLMCEFSEDVYDEIASHLEGYGNIRPSE